MSAVLTPLPPQVGVSLMSADEFLRLHGDDSGVELVEGQLVRLPMPGFQHGEVCFHVALILGGFVKANRLGRLAINDTFIRTRTDPDGVRGADVMFISYTTLPSEVPTPKGAVTPPVELVAEVRSPTDSLNEMMAKALEYTDAGVKVVLLLDPDGRFAAVFRKDQLPQRFEADQTLTLPDVLPGFAVPVASFFE